MSNKRKYNVDEDDDNELQALHVSNKKHTLDSDEEDSDYYEKDDIGDSEIDGEEEGESKVQDKIKITPFNMREELEEGHFDKDGHFHWEKSNEIKDNWLENIDWVKIEEPCPKDTQKVLNSTDNTKVYNEPQLYRDILSYMKEGETIGETIRRISRNRKRLSTAERLKLKKQDIVDKIAEDITKITEMANEILTNSGNMDVYQFTYEDIKNKLESLPGTSKEINLIAESFDIYSDDFNEKEKRKLFNCNYKQETKADEVFWEFKWKNDDTEIQGPFKTIQMLKWSKNGYFKSGVYVRKVGELSNLYKSNRIDFELYL